MEIGTLEQDQRVAVTLHCSDPLTGTKLETTITGRVISIPLGNGEELVFTLSLDEPISCPEEWLVTAIDWKRAA